MARGGKQQTEQIREEFKDKAGKATRELDPAKAPEQRRAQGKPTEGPDVRETVRRKARESTS